MCGRYTLVGDAGELEKKLLARYGGGGLVGGRHNVSPRQQIPIIERAETDAAASVARVVRQARWGLLPAWAKTSKDKLQPINARADKLLESKMWRPLMKAPHRVLIPADGYYEWVKPEKKGQKPAPFLYEVDGGGYFAFAGLLNTTKVDDLDEPITTATIITTDPNELAAQVHDRMPAILGSEEEIEAWISPNVSAEEAHELLRPIESSRLSVRPEDPLAPSLFS